MATKGYHSYSGRKNKGKIALIVLLVLILLGALAYLFAQKYVVYDGDGTIRLELPFFKGSGETDKPDPLPEVEDGDIQREDESPEDAAGKPVTPETPEASQKPAQKPALQILQARELPYDCLTSDPAAYLEGQGAVVVNVKRFDGALAYKSAIQLPQGVLQGSEATLSNLKAITSSECYTVARLAGLCDNAYAMARPDSAMRYPGGGLWYDNYSRSWLDPSRQETVNYLCALARELQELGFDELLLDQFRYPIEGDLSLTTMAADIDRGGAISSLVSEIRKSAPGMAVSVMLPASLGTDYSFQASGLPASVLGEAFDRIYVPRESAAYYWVSEALGADYDRQNKLVLCDYFVPGDGGSYLVLQ